MTTTRPVSDGLAQQLRLATRPAHEHAEAAPFVGALLAGQVPLSGFTALAAQHHALYSSLERHADAYRGHPVVGAVVHDELVRLPHLQADLAVLLGDDWAARAAGLVAPATARYVAHLDAVLPDSPAAFVAHHYVRYLGDLSGGQLVRRAVERSYGDTGASASAFYRFEAVAAVKPFRDRYRAVLDSLGVDTDEVVREAVSAFALNRAVFDDLAARYC